MPPVPTTVNSTALPGLVSRRRLPLSKNPDSAPPWLRVNKCTIPSDTRVWNSASARCPAAAAEDWAVPSTPGDDVAVDAGEDGMQGRRWSALDVGTVGVVVVMHALSLFAPFYFTWGALWAAVGLYMVTGLFGITLSFHRNLSHRSFKLPKWLEYTFAYCGVLALQGNPIDWVSTHRHNHVYCDSDKDPHSPLQGFWFSHMTWLFDKASVLHKCGGPTNVVDLQRQPFYRFLQRTYLVHPLGLGLLLYSLGGLPFLVWGMGVRIVWVYHITWFVNSACHVWGNQAWNTGDLSKNNWWVAVLAFGEGWHNNHHAFEYSARHGLEWWQVDMTWNVIRFLQAIRLATDVKLPSEAHKHRLALKPNNN
ncbi:hypothetical protein MLD38_030156 [Melastoma candidum]|uniref:Uncharacterized protein n=1 Tax=Melastoma candidum TaxID=119954 RepID=A0ACB9MMA6_9MYRT|nr:hypothetical protein MLD38_030156 [Melastoma candidum]